MNADQFAKLLLRQTALLSQVRQSFPETRFSVLVFHNRYHSTNFEYALDCAMSMFWSIWNIIVAFFHLTAFSMAIAESEIERVKQTVSLADVVRSRGVILKKKGRQLWGLCPFHVEDEPSFAVDERKGLWNCLGKCQTGGDVFSFVMKADAINFKQAFELLAENQPSKTEGRKAKPVVEETTGADVMTKAEIEYLEKAAAYYHKSLLKNEKAMAYLDSRGITPEAIRTFKPGYVDGSLKDKLNPDGKKNLESLGLLNERGNETMFGSVVFPLVDANTNQPVGLYARHLEKKQHLSVGQKTRRFQSNGGEGNRRNHPHRKRH